MIGKGLFGQIKPAAHLRHMQHEVAQHAGGLTALAGKQKGQLAAHRLIGQIDALAVAQFGLAGGQSLGAAAQQCLRLGQGPRDDAQPPIARRSPVKGAVARGLRQIGTRLVQIGLQDLHRSQKGRGIGSGQKEHLAWPENLRRDIAGNRRQVIGQRAQVRRDILLQNGMGVDAAKAKGIHPGPSRRVQSMHPRPRFGVQIKPCLIQPKVGVGRIQKHRRQDPVVQGIGGLDQPGRPGGGQAMADHRLDRPQRNIGGLAPARTKLFGKRPNLGCVPDGGCGAMRLDQTDRAGIDARLLIGARQGQFLALGAGCQNA